MRRGDVGRAPPLRYNSRTSIAPPESGVGAIRAPLTTKCAERANSRGLPPRKGAHARSARPARKPAPPCPRPKRWPPAARRCRACGADSPRFPSERRFALRVAGEQQGRALLAEHLAHQPRPRGIGKMRRVRRARSEIPADRRLFPVGQADALRLLQRVNAASGAALAKPLADEPRIGRLDRRGADAQVRRQLPLEGIRSPGRIPPRSISRLSAV